MELDLYKGRPGFQYPYEGPTLPAEENPDGEEEFNITQRSTHRVAPSPSEEIGPPSGESTHGA